MLGRFISGLSRKHRRALPNNIQKRSISEEIIAKNNVWPLRIVGTYCTISIASASVFFVLNMKSFLEDKPFLGRVLMTAFAPPIGAFSFVCGLMWPYLLFKEISQKIIISK